MRNIVAAVAMALFLLGCASASKDTSPAVYGNRTTDNTRHHHDAKREIHAGDWVVAAIGTPFYLVFKTAVCGVSLVAAAPTAAAIALVDSPYMMSASQLGDGLAANCGPPYVLSPS